MHAMLLCWMDQWPIKLRVWIKHVELWHGEHVEYDGMSAGVINQNGKDQWYLMMQSMSKLKKEEKTVMLKALAPRKLMIVCVWCMLYGDVLNLFLLHTSDHNWEKEHKDIFDGMDAPLV